MLQSGLFLFGAHPDVFGCSYLQWDAETESCARAILEAAQDLDIPLEINGNGFRRLQVQTESGLVRPYPLLPFWDLAAEYRITVIANSDAHVPNDVDANIQEATEFALERGLSVSGLNISERNANGGVALYYGDRPDSGSIASLHRRKSIIGSNSRSLPVLV
jgi:histidinol-phosphatase (PHP family)